MEYETLEYNLMEEGIGALFLNRPHVYNAVNQKMVEELEAFWKERLYDLDTHIIILRGNGDKGFCAGLDLKETMEITP
jgi:enoyl-CoA hydratase/carnithine racemase